MKFKTKPETALEAALRKRSYVHFDLRPSESEIERLVTNPTRVSKHAFYPFLRLDLIRNKVKKAASGNKQWGKKVREIRYASHADAAIYSYYNFLLAELYEKRIGELGLGNEVIAFRSLEKSNIHFAAEAFDWIGVHSPCVALGFDVKDFFGSLDHQLLKEAWSDLLSVKRLPDDHYSILRSITKHSSVELVEARRALGISRSRLEKMSRLCSADDFRKIVRGGKLVCVNPNIYGIPQGSPMSALLSNIYMLSFDCEMKQRVSQWNGFYRRYCDDILVIVPHEHQLAAHALVENLLKKLKLVIQDKKTLVCAFTPGADRHLQYLGFLYDGKKVRLRSGGIAKFFTKMRAGVKQYKYAQRLDGKTPLLVQRRKRLLNTYTEYAPVGHRNYMNYVKRASSTTGSKLPLRQLDDHFRRFNQLIDE